MISGDGRINKEWFDGLTSSERNSLSFKKHHPNEYNIIYNSLGDAFREKVYCYFNNITVRPKCPVCGKELKYRTSSATGGYMKYCSLQCVGKSGDVKNKRENTSNERYGEPHFTNRALAEQTCIEKYGVMNVSQADEVKQKRNCTCMERYGSKCTLNDPVIRSKAIETSRERYGVDYSLSLNASKYHDKSTMSRLKNVVEKNDDILRYTDDWKQWIMRCPHQECNKCSNREYIIESGMYYDRLRCGAEVCTTLLPPEKYRGSGTSIELFVRDILDAHGIEYECNVRDVIPPKELDIYIPSKHIAIECNGIYWHSRYEKRYHMNKFIACKDKGIQLLTVWEDQIRNSPGIVRSIILSKLGIYNRRIYARKCNIVELDSKTCAGFLDINHLQGRTPSQIRYGLEYECEIVGVMTFSQKSNDVWELTRFAVRQMVLCPGAAGKLLNKFINDYHPSEIISYSSNDISDGGVYKTLGFTCDDKFSDAYWYIDPRTMMRYHRSSFSRMRLSKIGYDMKGRTEEEVTREMGLLKIWDNGHMRWVKKL